MLTPANDLQVHQHADLVWVTGKVHKGRLQTTWQATASLTEDNWTLTMTTAHTTPHSVCQLGEMSTRQLYMPECNHKQQEPETCRLDPLQNPPASANPHWLLHGPPESPDAQAPGHGMFSCVPLLALSCTRTPEAVLLRPGLSCCSTEVVVLRA
jgi:hypothetical protein